MNSHSNTRSQLAPWENRLVVCDGILKTVRRRPDGDGADLLLVNCKVRLFDADLVLADQPSIAVDHMWDRVLDPEVVPTKLLTRQSGAGYVHQYTRADGSVDWAVQSCDAIRLDNFLVRMHNRFESGTVQDRREYRREKYTEIFDALAAGTPVYSMASTTRELLQIMRRELQDIEAQIHRESLAPAHGRCTRMRAADPFAALRRKKKQAAA